jgi:integrase
MDRERVGVKAASKSSIQLEFIYEGKSCRELIKAKPTAANLKQAEAYRLVILQSITDGNVATSVRKSYNPRVRRAMIFS